MKHKVLMIALLSLFISSCKINNSNSLDGNSSSNSNDSVTTPDISNVPESVESSHNSQDSSNNDSSSTNANSESTSSSPSAPSTSSSNNSSSTQTSTSTSTSDATSSAPSTSTSTSGVTSNSPSTSTSSSTSPSLPPDVGGNDLYDADLLPNYPEDYYEPVRGLYGEALKQALHDIIDDHDAFGYSSTTPYFTTIDVDPHNSLNIMMFYEGSKIGSTSYNKEHVWAKSHGAFDTTSPAGSDLHNLHPCNSNLNSTRGNLDFAEGGTLLSGYMGNNRRVTNVSFEPSDDFKGDTARTIFYMAVRYEGDKGNTKGEPDLELNSPSSSQYRDFSSNAKGVHGNFDDLYKWATSGQDPVDDYEVNRNNIIYSDYQHNRNPFIDHPEFIQMIYDKNYSGPGALLDNNPMVSKSQEELIEDFKTAVEAIGKVTLSSLDLIENAENIYSRLDEDSKFKVQSWYDILIEARETYDTLFKEQAVQETIRAIDAIGEVTLASKAAIEYAEKLYDSLDNSQKTQVTNYQTLLDARATYNELYNSRDEEEVTFVDENFANSQGASSSYKATTVKLGNVSFEFSSCYKAGNEFRLGNNKAASIPSSLETAIGKGSIDGSYFVSNQTFERLNYINLTTDGKYGTVTNVYFLISTDNGKTYELIEEFDNVISTQLIYDNPEGFTNAKLAVVIAGTTPRLILNHLTLKGFK